MINTEHRGSFTCAYCSKLFNAEENTKEHIIPQSLGGNLFNNPLLLDGICKSCNSTLGLEVDHPFSNSWLVSNFRAEYESKYKQKNLKQVIRPVFFGRHSELTYEDKICDTYLSAHNDWIYHFHKSYNDDNSLTSTVGIPLNRRKKDNGFVVIAIRPNSPLVNTVITWNSVEKYFQNTERYFLNVTDGDSKVKPMPPEYSALSDKLYAITGEQSTEFTVSIDDQERFLAKIALAAGTKFLNKSFVKSECAASLRNAMWAKTKAERDKMGLKFRLSIDEPTEFNELLKWNFGHSFVMVNNRTEIILLVSFYNCRCSTIRITKDIDYWDKENRSIVFLVAPTEQKWEQTSIEEFILHRKQLQLIPDLTKLENQLNEIGSKNQKVTSITHEILNPANRKSNKNKLSQND